MPMKKESSIGSEKKIDFAALPTVQFEPRYSVRVLESFEVAPDVLVLRLNRPDNFVFQEGQYVWLVLPKRSQRFGVVDRRAYSLCSSSSASTIELLIRLTGSDYLTDVSRLKKWDLVEIIGPMGSTFIPGETGAIFVAGGTGISSFLSVFRGRPNKNISLYAFDSVERPLYGKDELVSLARSCGSVAEFFTGLVTREQCNRIVSKKTDHRPIFISGPQGFVDTVFTHLISLGVKKERMRFEACYPQDSVTKTVREIFTFSGVKQEADKMQALTSLGNIFFQIAHQTSNHVVFTDKNGVVLYANDAARDITGYSAGEMYGQTPRLWGGLMPSAQYEKALWTHLMDGVSFKRTLLNRRRDGRLYVALASITPICENDTIIGYVATEEDITNLRDLDKTKTEFISIASHQLRTPLTAIRWYLEMILNGDAGSVLESQKNYLQEIYKGNARMIDLVNTLLDVSRIELGTFANKPEFVRIVDVAEGVFKDLEQQISTKRIVVDKNYDFSLPEIFIDPRVMQLIFYHLLTNAVKYVSDAGSVTCSIFLKQSAVIIKIWNNGITIPKNAKHKIFTKFFRDDLAREKEADGNGLGLYIVKSVVENFGGKVWFESEESSGTTFFVSLPLASMKKTRDAP